MSYSIKQAPIGARFGSGFGQGLSESIPKEIERGRLAEGLKQFEQQSSGLNPMQQLARLSSIPGITPQMIQSFGELAKQQNLRKNYQNPTARPGSKANNLQDVDFANLQKRNSSQPLQSGSPEVNQNIIENPLQKRFETIPPWTPERMDEQIDYHLSRNPNITLGEAQQLARDDEQRERAQPVAAKEIQEARKVVRSELDKEIDDQLQTILQKKGNEVYSDLTGEYLLNLKKSAFDDLSTNPNLNERTAAAKWIKKGRDLAAEKQELKKIAYRDIWDRVAPGKKEETLKKLLSAQKIYADTGNQREFYNQLRTSNGQDRWGFNLSPGGAASIAYPRSEGVKKLISENKNWGDQPINKLDVKSRKFAQDVSNKINSNDSLLAIARDMKQTNPYFNENAFFDYFRENQDNLGLRPHMKEELTTGVSDIFPNWGDIFLFPAFGRSKANE